jgi:putative phosphoesterase
MKIGILSDSHEQRDNLRYALNVLKNARVEAIVHCGDVGDDLVMFDELICAGVPVFFVWGNMDHPTPAWKKYFRDIGLAWPNGPLKLELDEKKIAVYHGHEPGFSRAELSGQFDYIFCGHSHQRRFSHLNGTTIINPGALHRAAVKSVAVLDTRTGACEFFDIEGTPLPLPT